MTQIEMCPCLRAHVAMAAAEDGASNFYGPEPSGRAVRVGRSVPAAGLESAGHHTLSGCSQLHGGGSILAIRHLIQVRPSTSLHRSLFQARDPFESVTLSYGQSWRSIPSTHATCSPGAAAAIASTRADRPRGATLPGDESAPAVPTIEDGIRGVWWGTPSTGCCRISCHPGSCPRSRAPS